MIEIKIPEIYYTEDPNQAGIKRSSYEIFIDGFKKLCLATGMTKISTDSILNLRIISQLKFDDGSMIGIKRLFNEIGFNI